MKAIRIVTLFSILVLQNVGLSQNIIQNENFENDFTGLTPGRFASFQLVANAAGAINPPLPAAFASQGFPTPGNADPSSAGQASGQRWAFHTGADTSSSAGGTRV